MMGCRPYPCCLAGLRTHLLERAERSRKLLAELGMPRYRLLAELPLHLLDSSPQEEHKRRCAVTSALDMGRHGVEKPSHHWVGGNERRED